MKRRRCFRLSRTNNIRMNFIQNFLFYFWILSYILIDIKAEAGIGCPQSEAILPCRCSLRGNEIQIWCSHSNLPQVMDGIKAVERNIKRPIDEFVLENNQLPALPGRFFGSMKLVRLMLRYNSIERVSNGWLNELENSLLEIYIVEPQLRSIPAKSLNGMINMVAITIQSNQLKYLPDISGLMSLNYVSLQSKSLTELQTHWFRNLPKLQYINIMGGSHLSRLENGLLNDLISLNDLDLNKNGINWIHLNALAGLPNLLSLKLSYNQISDVGMIGRIAKHLENLEKLRLDHNIVNIIEDGSFVDLRHLSELHLNDNRITEIEHGSFSRTPMLKTIYLHNNHIKKINPKSFLQASGGAVEAMYLYNNEIEHVTELRSILEALPALKFLDISNNFLKDIHFGTLRGHGTLEQLYLNNNQLRHIDRDALMAMPALRELRLRNNSLSHELMMPFWNLPGLKGLDLSLNNFRVVDSHLLVGLPSLRRLDLSQNALNKLDPSTFVHNPMLETLNISSNELVVIHPATFRNLNRLFEVDCSFNQLLEIMQGLPKIVERISLRGNLISSLPQLTTETLNLPNLRMLDLSLNRLQHLPKYTFQGNIQLRVLSLANNQLRTLEDTAFVGAYHLELLHLQENQLMDIDDRCFLPLSELKNLNLHSNKLTIINDNLFSNNSKLEQLNLSQNNVHSISPAAFELQTFLEYLDLSGNSLTDISISLANLKNLRDIDLSYNQISHTNSGVVSAWYQVVEIRFSNNLISKLGYGSFHNLPKLQYIDLSSNEISVVEPGAFKHLPELQELVLADNKLLELKDHVFEDLPNLLASHFQYNSLHFISSEAFFNSPSMVFLNLSNNQFSSMENIRLHTIRNLEVLDLSTNGIKMISTMPLKSLNWLVEFKIDNNEICKIQGSPFEMMPRLRVLSMRNNRLRTIKERIFKNLRGNIALLDMDGNPIDCSCEMQWLSVWLQETNYPYPGPKCQDGRLLRMFRTDKQLCNKFSENNRKDEIEDSNHLPLHNEHGDIFQRDLYDQISEECEIYEIPASEKPLVGESEYFYDQYVDYLSPNETLNSQQLENSSTSASTDSSNSLLKLNKKPIISTLISSNIDLNNTILNTNYFKKKPISLISSYSPFTFFGYPIPSLSLGRYFGDNQRKDRGDNANNAMSDILKTNKDMPATHRMHTGSGKVRMYQPNSSEFEKYLKDKVNKAEVPLYANPNNHTKFTEIFSDEILGSSENPLNIFKTSFRGPANIERGGFKPILPERSGGFTPVQAVQDISRRRGIVEVLTSPSSNIKTNPLKKGYKKSINVLKHDISTTTAVSKDIDLETDYVTESSAEENITYRPTTQQSLEKSTSSVNKTMTTMINSISGTKIMDASNTTDKDFYESEYNYDLEAQSVGMLGPPLFIETTTPETILLIPPPEEFVEQSKRLSWINTTPKEDSEKTNNMYVPTLTTTTTNITELPDSSIVLTTSTVAPLAHLPRLGGTARSTITKVHTPQTLNFFLPSAEEYQRTAPSLSFNLYQTEKPQLTANSRKNDAKLIDGKESMDWYYASFKKTPISGSIKSGFSDSNSLRGSAVKRLSSIYWVLTYLGISNLQNQF